jgi:hypothetical protein
MSAQVLNVVIGLTYAFLLLSLLCSALREVAASAFQTRAKVLLDGILQLFQESESRPDRGSRLVAALCQLWRGEDAFGLGKLPAGSLTRAVLTHPQMKALAQDGRLPSYIPSTIFARSAIVALLEQHPQAAASHAPGAALIGSMANRDLARTLRSYVGDGQADIPALEEAIRQQYEVTMDRVTGWYKRRSQLVLFGMGLFLAVAMNVDTLSLTQRLWADPGKTEAIVSSIELAKFKAQVDAQRTVGSQAVDPGPAAAVASKEDVESNLDNLQSLPIGWQASTLRCDGSICASALFTAVAGWVISAFAASLGAPFWFDGLGKLLVLRGSGTPERKEEAATKLPPILPPFSVKVRSTAAANLFETEELSVDDIRAIQCRLDLAGQAISGRLDQTTRDAIRRFQVDAAEAASGSLSPQLVKRILAL